MSLKSAETTVLDLTKTRFLLRLFPLIVLVEIHKKKAVALVCNVCSKRKWTKSKTQKRKNLRCLILLECQHEKKTDLRQHRLSFMILILQLMRFTFSADTIIITRLYRLWKSCSWMFVKNLKGIYYTCIIKNDKGGKN